MTSTTRPRVCIYTAICGGYDDLKPQPSQTIACDFICFTDDPARAAPAPWRLLPLEWMVGAPDRLRAKLPKIMPHAALPAADYDFAIWIDGSVQIIRSDFAEALVAAARETGLAAVRHPERDCIYDEALAALGRHTAHKCAGMPVREQVEHYRADGFPEHHGLLAGGMIARDMRDPAVRELGERWWAEIRRWSVRDQLSLPYVLWKLGARCNALDLDVWRNRLFEVWPHFDAASDDLALRARPEFSAEPFAAAPGRDALGLYSSETGLWFLRDAAGDEIPRFQYGAAGAGWIGLSGDWDGDGFDSPGLYDPASGTFFLRNTCTAGNADAVFLFGAPGGIPIAGDWDGDGRDSVGLYYPEAGYWTLKNSPEPGVADVAFIFGGAKQRLVPIAGDWDGRGRDCIGLYEPVNSTWSLSSELATGATVETFHFGIAGSVPVVGDWNADGTDEAGIFVAAQGQAFLARTRHPSARCWRALVDASGTFPLAGRWSSRAPG